MCWCYLPKYSTNSILGKQEVQCLDVGLSRISFFELFFRCCCRFSYHLTAAVGRGSEMLSWFLFFSFSFCFHWIYLGILWFLHFMNSWRNVALFLMKRLMKGNILELILECHWVFSFIVCRFCGWFFGGVRNARRNKLISNFAALRLAVNWLGTFYNICPFADLRWNSVGTFFCTFVLIPDLWVALT